MKKKKILKRLVAGLMVLSMCFVTAFGVPFFESGLAEVRADNPNPNHNDTPKIPAGVSSRIAAFGEYGISQLINGIADSIYEDTDDDTVKQIVSFIDTWILGQGTTNALNRITEMCNDILNKLDEIEANQLAYGNAILGQVSDQATVTAQDNLSYQISKDVTAHIDDYGLGLLMEKYKKYLQAAQDYNEAGGGDTSALDVAEKDYLMELCKVYGFSGAISNEDALQLVMTSQVVDDKLSKCIDAMTSALNPTTSGSLTVADRAAALAYRYYPWSQDQYQFVTYEIDSQLQQIAILEMIYQDLVGRQYEYNTTNGYFDNGFTDYQGNVVSAQACLDTYIDNEFYLEDCNYYFATRLSDMLERDLQVAPGITLKLRQYYKPTDRDMDRDEDFNDDAHLHGENLKNSFNVWDERDDYLYDDFHGGPIDDSDPNKSMFNYDVSTRSGGNTLRSELYPVVRNGGVSVYYLSLIDVQNYDVDVPYSLDSSYFDLYRYRSDGSLYYYNSYSSFKSLSCCNYDTGWWAQWMPDAKFFNLIHGKWYEKYAYDHGIENEYRPAKNDGEAQPLFNSPSFLANYEGIPTKYLDAGGYFGTYVLSKPFARYIVYSDYRVTGNHNIFGPDGNVYFKTTNMDAVQNAGDISMSEYSSADGNLLDLPYSVMIPQSTDTYASVSVKSSYGGSASAEPGPWKAGEYMTIRITPDEKKLPGEITLTDYKTGVTKKLIDVGAAASFPANDDGSYDIDIVVPYYGGTITVNFVDAPEVNDETNAFTNIHNARFLNSKSELGDIFLNDKEKFLLKWGVCPSVKLTGTARTSEVTNEEKSLVEKSLPDSGYKVLPEYFDLNVYKKAGGSSETEITELPSSVKVQLNVPEKLRNQGRIFTIIRLHNGKADTLPTTYDEEAGTLSFDSDRFSTYAFAYKDTLVIRVDKVPKTGDKISIFKRSC